MASTSSSWVRGKCVGKGSFGTVTIGVSKSDGRVFAVKSVDRNNSGHVYALENEIRILRSLSSPYVVRFLGDDVTCEGGAATTSYRNLHMEYLPGGTLADLDSADVDERVVRYFTWCVVNALRYVHSRGVVHCDVKGRNVLVGFNGGVAKLADFGSAVEMSRSGAAEEEIVPRGSPLWMAPEVIRREAQGPESDVWSLGCTVVEMVTGKPIWEDRGFDTLSRIGYSDELPELPSQLSELGRDFVEKCLRREPRERWSCDQLLQHPFLLSTPPNYLEDSSPRCVLDWVNNIDEFAEEEEEEEMRIDDEKFAKERIGKLATKLRVNWELEEGWVSVRALGSDAEAITENESGHEDEGTSSEYVNLVRVEEEIEVGTSWEYLEKKRVNVGVCNCGGDHSKNMWNGYRSMGLLKGDIVAKINAIKLLLLLLYNIENLLFFANIFKNILFFEIIYIHHSFLFHIDNICLCLKYVRLFCFRVFIF